MSDTPDPRLTGPRPDVDPNIVDADAVGTAEDDEADEVDPSHAGFLDLVSLQATGYSKLDLVIRAVAGLMNKEVLADLQAWHDNAVAPRVTPASTDVDPTTIGTGDDAAPAFDEREDLYHEDQLAARTETSS